MNIRTPTPTPAHPSDHSDWYIDSAYINARLREARRARSIAFGQILADGWHALGRFPGKLLRSVDLVAGNKQPAPRH